MKITRSITALWLLLLTGCMSPEAARKGADTAARRIIENGQTESFGETQPFTLIRPSDTLRRKLMLEQQLPSVTNNVSCTGTGEVAVLSFTDCLQIGARNNNEYQNFKERIFRAALALDLQQYAFDNSFSGILSGSLESDTTGENDVNEAKAGLTTGISRTLRSGATLAGNISLDVVRLLTGDRESSFGVVLDTTITIPMLRGAGREIVTEPLTQAERNVLYALLLFERHKKTYAVQVAGAYLSVLQDREKVMIAKENLDRLETSLQRAEKLSLAGRLPGTELDQTYQDVLRARNRLITAQQKTETNRDVLKRTLGLPVDARIRLNEDVLTWLTNEMARRMEDENRLPGSAEQEELRAALEQRLDLKVMLRTVEDAIRRVRVSANALKAGVEIKLSGTTSQRHFSGGNQANVRFGDGNYSGGLDVDLPWNRRDERNAYRATLIDLDLARRALEEKEDDVKKEVREAFRKLKEAQETYQIQTKAVQLAEKRVKSTAIFLESGRAQTRDLLESQEALVNARSALTDALVSYYSANWNLLRDTGELRIDSNGIWNLDYQN